MIPDALPTFREGTQATCNKTIKIHKGLPSVIPEVESTTGNKDNTASFGDGKRAR